MARDTASWIQPPKPTLTKLDIGLRRLDTARACSAVYQERIEGLLGDPSPEPQEVEHGVWSGLFAPRARKEASRGCSRRAPDSDRCGGPCGGQFERHRLSTGRPY